MKFGWWVLIGYIIFVGVCLVLISQSSHHSPKINHDAISKILRQTFRWYVASKQDSNPIIRLLHSDYAVGYLDALRLVATDDEIQNATGINAADFMNDVTSEQNIALLELYKSCPTILPNDDAYKKYAGLWNKISQNHAMGSV